jgi:hypothetical protein
MKTEIFKKDSLDCKFALVDLDDDNLVCVKISAPSTRTNITNIDFEFRDDATGAKKVLSFDGCANLRYIMDFDVLANNWVAQTELTKCNADTKKMKAFVRAQVPHWHVQYMPPSPRDLPIRKKLSSIRKYRLFKITFYGGTVEILARQFTVRASKRK